MFDPENDPSFAIFAQLIASTCKSEKARKAATDCFFKLVKNAHNQGMFDGAKLFAERLHKETGADYRHILNK